MSEPSDRASVHYRRPWRIDVVHRGDMRARLSDATLARAVAAALDAARAPHPASVTVVLTNDAELADLNREHVGVDGPTDVLSFPMLPPASFRRHGTPRGGSSAGQAAIARPGPRRTHIGDIAISVERAIEQAEQGRGGHTGDVRWSAGDELRLLVTHGTLHLCGWDHAEPGEEAAMRALERDLLGSGLPLGRRRR